MTKTVLRFAKIGTIGTIELTLLLSFVLRPNVNLAQDNASAPGPKTPDTKETEEVVPQKDNEKEKSNNEQTNSKLPDKKSEDNTSGDKTQGDDYYGELYVTVTGVKQGDKEQKPVPAVADVYINDTRVGKTPYHDGLPEGTYLVEIRHRGEKISEQTITVVSGGTYKLSGQVVVPLTAEEREALELKKEEERRKKEEELRAKAEKARAWQIALRAEWEAEYEDWQSRALPLKVKRKPYLYSAIGLAAGGVGLLIAGIACTVRAYLYDGAVHTNYERWLMETNPEFREVYAERIDDYSNSRNINIAIGITGFAVGGVALATSAFLFVIMPRIPEQPAPPPGLRLTQKANMYLTPEISLGALGAKFHYQF